MQENATAARIARTSAALAIALIPTALLISGFVGRALGRGLLLLAGVAALVCLAASLRLLRRDAQTRSQAGTLVMGAVCVLGGGAYMWSVRNVPAAIPIGGVLAIMLGLVLLTVGVLAWRPRRTHGP